MVSPSFYRKNLNRFQSFLKRFVNKVVYRCDILRTSKYGETEKKDKCLKCKETARSGQTDLFITMLDTTVITCNNLLELRSLHKTFRNSPQ